MQNYRFEQEFTSGGELISVPGSRHVTRLEAEEMSEEARRQAQAGAEAEIARNLSGISEHLQPVAPVLREVCGQLRREAVELALAAARGVIGGILELRGAELAAEAIGREVCGLKSGPEIEVWVSASVLEEVRERLLASGLQGFRFCTDAGMSSGDWRVCWEEGSVDFDSEEVMERLSRTMRRCLEDSSDFQADLFAEGD